MATTKQPKPNGLIGMFLHTFKEGRVENQGCIIGIEKDELHGDMVLVQLFSFLTGDPTNVRAIPRSVIYSDEVKLYANNQSMLDGYEREERRYAALNPPKAA